MQQIITADYEHPLTDTCHIAFKLVKKGTFLMGSEDKEAYDDEKPVHLVNIQKDFYRHMCDMFLEMVKTLNLSKEELKERYKIINIEVLQEIVKEKSVLIVCSHYANWEWNVSINNYVNAKGYAVYQKIGNSYFDNLIKASHFDTLERTENGRLLSI